MDKVYLLSYKILLFLVRALPKKAMNGFLNFLAFLFYKFDKKHNKIMRTNIQFCFENLNEKALEKLIFDIYKNYAFFAGEFLINQSLGKDEILKKVNFINERLMINAINSKRPIIVQSVHYGNWELVPLAMAAKFGAASVVGRRLDSGVMDEILKDKREKFDIELIDKRGGAKNILKALKNNRLVGILVDQNTARDDGIKCTFFGKNILHTPAVSIFAQKTNALIISAFARRNPDEKDKTDIIFKDIIDIKNFNEDTVQIVTQMQSDLTQKIIEEKPDEYFWFHKKFKHFYEAIYA